MSFNPKNLKIRLIAIFIGMGFLAVFFLSNKPEIKSEEQRRFDEFVQAIEVIDRSSTESSPEFPQFKLSLNIIKSGLTLSLSSSTSRSDPRNKQIVRLIQIARESEIFAVPSSVSPEIQITVASDNQNFQKPLRLSDIANNSAAQNLIKLFQVYSDLQAGEK